LYVLGTHHDSGKQKAKKGDNFFHIKNIECVIGMQR